MQGRTNGCRWSAEGISQVHKHCKTQHPIELLTLVLGEARRGLLCRAMRSGWLGIHKLVSTSSTCGFLPAPKFSVFWAHVVSSKHTEVSITHLSLGAVTRPNFAQRLELLWALPRWDLWHFNTLIVCLYMSKVHFLPKAQHTATSLIKERHLLNDLFPPCFHHLGAGRDNVVPLQFSCRCTVLAEFLRTSFLAPSVNDSLAVFRSLLLSAVG